MKKTITIIVLVIILFGCVVYADETKTAIFNVRWAPQTSYTYGAPSFPIPAGLGTMDYTLSWDTIESPLVGRQTGWIGVKVIDVPVAWYEAAKLDVENYQWIADVGVPNELP